MNWKDCHNDNKAFTTRYDEAVRLVREKLGSYDKISHLIFQETGDSVAGVSVRRWLLNRSLPITYACTLVDLMEGDISLLAFFPYLGEYIDDFLD